MEDQGAPPAVSPGQPVRERYNTQFIVANFERDARRTRLIIAAVALAVCGGIGVALFVSANKAPEAHPAEAGAPATAAPKAEAPKAAAPKAEAPKAAAPKAEAPKAAAPAAKAAPGAGK